MARNIIPFCPKCGRKDNVESQSEYLNSWKCGLCLIRFDFSEIDVNIALKSNLTKYFLLDPPRKFIVDTSMKSITGSDRIIDIKLSKNLRRVNLGPTRLK